MTKKQLKEVSDILSDADLATYCPDLPNWPTSWHYEKRDLAPGEQLVALLQPFLLHLLRQGLTRKTFNLHRDNLWTLGGEIIRDLHETPALRKRPVKDVVSEAIADGEGPLIYGCISENTQNAFDSTCRKLHRFLMAS